MTDDLEDRLSDVLRRLTDTPEPVAHVFRGEFRKHGLSPSDLRVIIASGDRESAFSKLIEENRGLRAENHRLRGAKGLTWDEFVRAAGSYIDTHERSWRGKLAKLLGCAPADFQTWEQMGRVPLTMLKALDQLPNISTERAAKRLEGIQKPLEALVNVLCKQRVSIKQATQWLSQIAALGGAEGLDAAITAAFAKRPIVDDQHEADRREWSDEDYQRAIAMLIGGSSSTDVETTFNLRSGQFDGKFINRAPDESKLAGPVEVYTDGPMEFLELWKIGYDLYQTGWRAKVEKRFKLARRAIGFNSPDELLTAEMIQELRAEWHARRPKRKREARETKVKIQKLSAGSSFSKNAQAVRLAVRQAGKHGMTKTELEDAGIVKDLRKQWHRSRCEELIKSLAIFPSGEFRRGDDVLVDHEWRHDFPEAFRFAQETCHRLREGAIPTTEMRSHPVRMNGD